MNLFPFDRQPDGNSPPLLQLYGANCSQLQVRPSDPAAPILGRRPSMSTPASEWHSWAPALLRSRSSIHPNTCTSGFEAAPRRRRDLQFASESLQQLD